MHKIDATHSIEDTHFIGSSVQYTHLNYSCVSQKSLCQHSLPFLRNLYWQEKCQEVCWQSCSGSALAASLPQDSFPLSLHFAGKQLICAMSETKTTGSSSSPGIITGHFPRVLTAPEGTALATHVLPPAPAQRALTFFQSHLFSKSIILS